MNKVFNKKTLFFLLSIFLFFPRDTETIYYGAHGFSLVSNTYRPNQLGNYSCLTNIIIQNPEASSLLVSIILKGMKRGLHNFADWLYWDISWSQYLRQINIKQKKNNNFQNKD